jgi:hypothetical protein
MSVNLREQVEKDLGESLENEWGLPVVLIDPDGVVYNTLANDPTAPLMGQVLYGKKEFNPETGQDVHINTPIITLRISSLIRVPQDGETWGVKIPVVPSRTAALVDFIFMGRPLEGGASIGFLRIYPQKAGQV